MPARCSPRELVEAEPSETEASVPVLLVLFLIVLLHALQLLYLARLLGLRRCENHIVQSFVDHVTIARILDVFLIQSILVVVAV